MNEHHGAAPQAGLPGAVPPPPGQPASSATATNPDYVKIVLDYLQGPTGRAQRRPTPRFSVLIAVAGAILIVGGLVGASALDEVPEALLIVAYLGLTVGGYALVWFFKDGPVATAGATASALSLPLLLILAFGGADAPAFPVFFLSGVGWLAAYLIGPGRGHVVYATLPLIGISIYAVNLFGGDSDGWGDVSISVLWGLVIIGGAYLGIAFVLDRVRLAGIATVFAGAGNFIIVTGSLLIFSVAGFGSDTDLFSTSSSSSFSSRSSSIGEPSYASLIIPGVVLTVAGILMIRYGVAGLRRATAWSGTYLLIVGPFALVVGLFGANGTLLAFAVGGMGIILVGVGYLLSTRIGEADELAEAPSFTEIGLLQALKDSLPVQVADDPNLWRSFGGTAWYAPSDGAVGEGWWQASDGNWYPPDPSTAPPPPAAAPAPPVAESTPPAPGWWQASDGNWYPPADIPEAPAGAPAPPAAAPIASDDLPPAPGWWKAADGRWYPPEES